MSIRHLKSTVLRGLILYVLMLLWSLAGAQLSPAGWPKLGGNSLNTGQSSASGATSTLSWQTALQNSLFSSPVTGPNGTVTIAAGSTVYGINPKSGATMWSYVTGNFIFASPTVGLDGTIYIGSSDGNMYALDGTTGALKWKFKAAGVIYSSATIDPAGVLYFGDIGSDPTVGNLYALASTTGAAKWSIETAGIDSSPAIDSNGVLYVGSCDFNVYAFTASTGLQKWKFATGSYVESAPAIGNETVYVSSDDGYLYALSQATGSKQWSYKIGPGSANPPNNVSSPAIGSNGLVYVGSFDNYLYALEASTGTLAWRFKTGSSIQGSPVLDANGIVYIGPGDGIVHAINGSTGASLWSATPASSSSSSPAIGADGTVYFAAGTGLAAYESIHLVSVTITPTAVTGGTGATGTVTLNLPAPTGGAVIALSSNNTSVTVPAKVTIPGGQTSATFNVTTAGVTASVTPLITGTYNGYSITGTVTVTPSTLVSITVPSPAAGSTVAIGTVTLSGPAGPAGTAVTLTTNSAYISIPAKVVIPFGATSAPFNITVSAITAPETANITAASGSSSFSGTMSLVPALLVSLTATQGGGSYSVTATLSGPAPVGGITLNFSSNNSAISIPATIIVPAGASSLAIGVAPLGVTATTQVVITASYHSNQKTATFTLTPPTVLSIGLSPATVNGGTSAICTVTLTGVAPTGGAKVSVSSGNADVTVPGSVTVLANKTSITFTAATKSVTASTPVTLTFTLNGSTQTATLTVIPVITIVSVSVSPSTVRAGVGSTGTVTLSGQVPAGSITVNLSSSDPAATFASPGLIIAAGKSSATFAITTHAVTSQVLAGINCSYNQTSHAANLTITPLSLVSMTLNPPAVFEGGTSLATVIINAPAPTGGLTVNLKSTSTSATAPATATVAAGQTSVTFNVAAVGYSTDPVGIEATYGASAQGAELTINSQTIASLTLDPPIVQVGKSAVATVTIDTPAPAGGLMISVKSSSASVTVPATIQVAAGQTSAQFSAKAVSEDTAGVTITASYRSTSQSANLIAAMLGSIKSVSFNFQSPSDPWLYLTFYLPLPSTVTPVKLQFKGLNGNPVTFNLSLGGGSTFAAFSIVPLGMSDIGKQTLTATDEYGKSVSYTSTFRPLTVDSITLSPSTVTGATSVTATLTLNGYTLDNLNVSIMSSYSLVTVPSYVLIATGVNSATFTIKTSAHSPQVTVLITASTNEDGASTTLIVNKS